MISFDSAFPSRVLSATRLEAAVSRFQDVFPVQVMVRENPDAPPLAVSDTAEGDGPEKEGKARPSPPSGMAGDSLSLSEDERELVRELSIRDQQVRAHEMAHVAAGSGIVTSGASYQYVNGPDGKRYAVGGEVSIDTSPGKTPEETLAKAQRIRAAAMAPADPSPQDVSVASFADQMAAAARAELASRQMQEATGRGETQEEDPLLEPMESALPPEEEDAAALPASVGSARSGEAVKTGPDFIPGDDIAKALFGIPITEKQPDEEASATSPIPGLLERRRRADEMRPYPEFQEKVKGKTIEDIQVEQKTVIQFREIPGLSGNGLTSTTGVRAQRSGATGAQDITFSPSLRGSQARMPDSEPPFGAFRRVIAAYFDSRLALLPDPRGGRVNLWA